MIITLVPSERIKFPTQDVEERQERQGAYGLFYIEHTKHVQCFIIDIHDRHTVYSLSIRQTVDGMAQCKEMLTPCSVQIRDFS